jgi:hypothetical protein
MPADVKQLKRRLSSMEGARQPHEPTWAECFDASYPERGAGLNNSVTTSSETQSKKNRILDDTLADAVRILSSAVVSGTTPANSLWFGMGMGSEGDDDGDAAKSDEDRWLEQSAKTVFQNIHGANFDPNAYEGAIDLAVAGWFVLYIDEAEEGGYHFELWPIAECFVSSSKAGDRVDTVFRKVKLTVEQVVNKYGQDKCSAKVQTLYTTGRLDEMISVCHAIYPRKLSMVGAKLAKNLPFASCHFEIDGEHLLKESGYHEFPCVVPRWMLIPGTSYATGPASKALGSVRSLQDVKVLELANLDMAVAGMWIGVDDGILNPRTVKIGARKMITAASIDSMKELRSSSNFDVAFMSEERLQAQIRKVMLADQLQPQDGPAMTATEVHARIQLIRQLLGPIYARLQAEYLQPLIERCFGLAYRAGILGAAPESIQGKPFVVKYVSPLARAQRMEEVTAIDQYIAGTVAIAEAYPDALDTVDFDAAQHIRADALGVPSKVVPTSIQIAKKRKDRAEAQQAAQEKAAQTEAMVKAAPQMAGKMVA